MGRGGGTISCQAELNEREEESHPAKGEHDLVVGVEVLHGCEVVIRLFDDREGRILTTREDVARVGEMRLATLLGDFAQREAATGSWMSDEDSREEVGG